MKNYFKYLINIKKNKFFEKEIELLITYKFFYKKKILVFYPTLIPRYDTENIINIFNNLTKNIKEINVYELGCGSNNINKSLKHNKLKNINIDKNFLSYLTKDITKQKQYIFSDWTFLIKSLKKCKLIITNPPYIEKKEVNININNKLTKHSLLCNKNGLSSIYFIIKKSKNILLNNGIIIIEHGYNQAKKIRYYAKINGFNSYELNDYNNIKRFIYLDI
ncbi:MAG TPA: hypothetical protein ACYCC7_00455 [Candidatus Azoamicus sp. MARI]